MNYLSVCSGIEAATCAWHSLGWQALAYSEIEPFPSAVLAHHYPTVPNLGDMTQYKEWNFDKSVDLLVGGTPCQSFSVAGLRKGMDDPRGNLALVFLGIADHFKPQWIVWENVPGVLSSSGGRDFGSFLGGLVELGYGFAYRVLDAQYFGVAQRRRRVFVVGYLGDWRPASAVLFERHSLCGHPAPSRTPRKATTSSTEASSRASSFYESSLAQYRGADVGGTLKASGGVLSGGSETFVVNNPSTYLYERVHGGRVTENASISPSLAARAGTGGNNLPIIYTHVAETSPTILSSAAGFSRPGNAVTEHETYIASAIPIHAQATRFQGGGKTRNNDGKGNGFGVGADGNPMNTLTTVDVHAVAYGFEPGIAKREGSPNRFVEEATPTLRANMEDNQIASAHTFKVRGGCEGGGKGYLGQDEKAFTISTHQDQHVAIGVDVYNDTTSGATASTLMANGNSCSHAGPKVTQNMAVRRLTPIECERLQGFQDGYTDVPWRKSSNAPDGPRYKALGNSMAVPVMRWIGERIQAVENEIKKP